MSLTPSLVHLSSCLSRLLLCSCPHICHYYSKQPADRRVSLWNSTLHPCMTARSFLLQIVLNSINNCNKLLYSGISIFIITVERRYWKTAFDWAEGDLRNIRTVGECDSPVTWSHPVGASHEMPKQWHSGTCKRYCMLQVMLSGVVYWHETWCLT
jgi:hypothetical protein